MRRTLFSLSVLLPPEKVLEQQVSNNLLLTNGKYNVDNLIKQMTE